MNRRIFLKLGLCLGIALWSFFYLMPLKSIPFDEYLLSKNTNHQAEFLQIIDQARQGVESGKYGSVFLGLKAIGESKNIDYSRFFERLNIADIKNIRKRNDIILNHLLRESQPKLKQGLDLNGGVGFTLEVGKATGNHQETQLEKAVSIMASRLDGLGIAEPIIRPRGINQIEVQLPGVSTQENPEVVQSLKKPAKLEFRFLHDEVRPGLLKRDSYPSGYESLALINSDEHTDREITYFVKRIPVLTGKAIKDAFVIMTPSGDYEIGLNFTKDGAEKFEKITRENVGKQLGIVLDGQLYSAPVIKGPISGGHATISGNFSYRTALELANVLNNPLEFELKLQELYEVGPSLAKEAKSQSMRAAFWGSGLVVIFMVSYYYFAGLISVMSVFLNILIVLALLASMGATITLPGIAGLVLTIGMGVDANILIFERIREELKLGKSLPTALLAGHQRAFSSILDANLTTLLTAGILIWLGTGPIKGFGITVAVGIVSSMFCVLVFSRTLLEYCIESGKMASIFPVGRLRATNWNFMGLKKVALMLSIVLIIVSVVVAVQKADKLYGVDFLGGEEITLSFEQKIPIEAIEHAAKIAKVDQIVSTYRQLSKNDEEILKIQVPYGQSERIARSLNQQYPQSQFKVIGETSIGASVSHHLKRDALWGLSVAVCGILIYVAFRFEIGFGMGAVVSTVHDILMTIGIFILLGGQFTASMVAAILMVVGYSINDTIVVFDRIREELKLNTHSTLVEIINISINKTLSRTLLTSLTTLVATVSLYIWGAGSIQDFALTFLIGIIVGTFSSIFIASPIFYWWHKGDRRHVSIHDKKNVYAWEASS